MAGVAKTCVVALDPARSRGFLSADSYSVENSRREELVRKIFVSLIVGLGVLSVWVCRYSMDPDTISYLDVGKAFAAGNWRLAFNTYWSPAYPWLLSFPVHWLGRTPRAELLTAHAVNFAIYLFSFGCFEFFLRTCLASVRAEEPQQRLATVPRWGLLAIGYALFLWSALTLITVWALGADQLVAGMIFLIAALMLRIREHVSAARLVALGVLLGVAYWCKAVMFPLGIVFGLVALVSVEKSQRRFYHTLLVAVPFALICFPLVQAISAKDGKWSFGDSGWLNYSSLVSPGGRVRNWLGSPTTSGIPLHPTRLILDNPPVFEFAEPYAVTYSPTFEPGYWNAGRTWTFDLRAQVRELTGNSLLFIELFLHSQSGLLVAVLALIVASGGYKRIFTYWPLLAISFATCALYALVHSEVRFVGAQAVIAWLAILMGVRLSRKLMPSRLPAGILIAASLSIVISVFAGLARDIRARDSNSALPQIGVVEKLHTIGFAQNTKMAIIGDGDWSYWAELGHFRLVAEIMSPDEVSFWALPNQQRQRVYNAMKDAGAAAIVTQPPLPLATLDDGWTQIGSTTFYLRSLK